MRCLPVCVDRDEALRRLERRSWWSRLFGNRGRRVSDRLDLVWVPHHLFTFQMETKPFGTTTVSVDACSGAFAIFQMEEDLLDNSPGDAELLPQAVTTEQAETEGRKKLLQAIMRRRGSQGPKPAPGKTVHTETVLFPFWVAYVTRGADRLDIGLLNAATGETGGNQTKTGVLHAFVDRSKNAP